MSKGVRISLQKALNNVKYLQNRTPEMAFTGGADQAFSEVSKYRDGAIYVGHYSGDSEWEKHALGDEIVMVLDGETTLVLLINGKEERALLHANELFVVPGNSWHRFKNSKKLKVMTVTPQPTEHSLEQPRA